MESDDYVPQFSQLTGDPNLCIGYQTGAGSLPMQPSIQDSYIPPTPAPSYGYGAPQPESRNVCPPPPMQNFPPVKATKGGGKKKGSPKPSAAQRNQQQTAPVHQLDPSGYPIYSNQPQSHYSAAPYGQGPQMQPAYQQQQHNPSSYGMLQQIPSQHHYQPPYQSSTIYRGGVPQQQLYEQSRYPVFQSAQRPSHNMMASANPQNYGTQQMRPHGQADGGAPYQYQGHAGQPRPYNPQYHLSPGSQYGGVGVQQPQSNYLSSMQQPTPIRQSMAQPNQQQYQVQQTPQMSMMSNINQHGYPSSETSGYSQQYADSQLNVGVSQTDQQTGYYRSQQPSYTMRAQPDQYQSSWQVGSQEKMVVTSSNQNAYSNLQPSNWMPANVASYPNTSHQQQVFCQPPTNLHHYQHSAKHQSVAEVDSVTKYVDSNLGLYANVLKNSPSTVCDSLIGHQPPLTTNAPSAGSNSINGKPKITQSAASPPPPPPKPITSHCAIQPISPALPQINVNASSTSLPVVSHLTATSSDGRINPTNISVPETIINPAYQNHIVSSMAPTSLAVVMPSDHRGPAVQLNIQPNSQPTTLITLYQFPAGSQPPTAHQLMAPVSQSSVAPASNFHSTTIPQEPIPKVSQTFTAEARVKSPIFTMVAPTCTTVTSTETVTQVAIESTEAVSLKIASFTKEAESESIALEQSPSVEEVQKVKKPKKKRIRTEVANEQKPSPRKKKKKTLRAKKCELLEQPKLVAHIEDAPSFEVSQNSVSFNSNKLDIFQLPLDGALDSSVGESSSAFSTNVSTPVATDDPKPFKKKKSSAKKSPKCPKEPKPKTVSKYAQKTRIRKRKKKSFDSEESEDEKTSNSALKKRQGVAATKSKELTSMEVSVADKKKDEEEEQKLQNYIEARRSNRLTKPKKYTEDWDLELDNEDREREVIDEDNVILDKHENVNDPKDPAAALFFVENPKEEDSHIVEKLLSVRVKRGKIPETGEATDVEEFFVKYKNFSYLHCEWKTAEELECGDKRIQPKIKRFRQKHQQALFLDEFDEDEPINPDYITVDRVLDVSTSISSAEAVPIKEELVAKNGQTKKTDCDEAIDETFEKTEISTKVVTHYLVKWRSLPYEECTWELESDIDPTKVTEFLERRNPPEKEKSRPKADEWTKVPDNVEYKNCNTLRDYQLEGINWLLFCWFNKQNCILADEMGLGKTIQTITFLIEVTRNNVRGPFLVIAPLSTIMNWQREFESWSDLNAIVYHGTFASRRMIQEYEMFYKNEKGEKIGSFFKFNVIITTYEMILVECELLKEIPWRVVVIDEAHRLKNRNCKLMTGLSQFKIEHRVLLTGTPLQNNIEELFSLLNFLEPKQFSNSQMFLQEFGTLQSDDQVQQLQAILKPMMLRRLKEDVEKSLKPKEETIIEVELTNSQKKYYRAILERNFAYLSKGSSVPSLMNTMMELRKCCNHPFLINGAEERILNEFRDSHPEVTEDEMYHHGVVHSSGKLVLIDKLLPRLRSGGHKVLVFSQMVRCLDILEDYLVHKKYPFERIDGNVRGDLRQAAIDRFCKPDADRFVFLLCTRAGGLGINLTAADTVIIFDSDWNPQNDLQAQARCHRIGQEKFVKVYRLICRNTYEREMFDKASMKLGLDKAVLQSNNKENLSALSKKEIEELLRKGAYGALMDETNEGDAFCEEDIDQILQRRTHTITIQPGVKGSTFAKASFAVSSNRSDIDVNDPNFWQKWAKKANVDTDFNPERDLILYEPRQRKRRFDDQIYETANNNSEESAGGESDSDTSGSGRGHGGKHRRKKTRANSAANDDDTDFAPDELAFSKSDYFRVEKFLSVHGWGRWSEIMKHCHFKQNVSENDAKSMCRTVLLHCLRQYNGDEKIKEFIWELISPPEDGGKTYDDIKNHQGLFGPVPRGRKSRQSTKNDLMNMYHQGWAALPAYNPPVLAVDYGYQRHLQRHANKVLLRVRLLYYLENEVISELSDEIHAGANADDVDINPPWHPEVPAPWWDREADKSLLMGIFKHGFENFDEMRRDPTLCFMKRCGLPGVICDSQAPTLKEPDFEFDTLNIKSSTIASRCTKDDGGGYDDADASDSKTEPPTINAEQTGPPANSTEKTAGDFLPFPSGAELNGRFRKLITLYQRTSKVTLAKEESKAKKAARQEQMQAVLQEREMKKLEERQRWSRREEGDFYRALVGFGVEQDLSSGEYLWDRFKQIARLESKFDHTLSEYYTSFVAMCKRVSHKQMTKEEECMSFLPEALSEERAGKVLQRVEFMARIRAALAHPKVNERILSAKRTPDLPLWWEAGKHDLDLLKAIVKHGLSKSEENIVPDREFSFNDVWKSLQKGKAVTPTRAITRTLSKLSGHSKEDALTNLQSSPPKDKDDPESTISQILALQTGGSILQWPKERSLIFRLQNLCHLVEKGEWSSARSFSALMDADQRSNTPDTPGLGTPGPSDDTPIQNAAGETSRASPAYSGSGFGSAGSKSLSGTQQDLNVFLGRNAGTGRRGGGGNRGRKRGNPLQDLMEGERERMRALMHQSFLHQLEQFPFGLPLPLAGASTSSTLYPSTSTSISSGKQLSAEEALNLSTKHKKDSYKDKKDRSAEVKPDPNDMFMFGQLSADTRVPVINLRDGSRLTGKDAPTLRSLAQFLFENQHYMIDMSTAPIPPASPTNSSALVDSELEPGEIVRTNRTSTATPSSVTDSHEHVTVINRKNGLRLSGVKAPQIKNLSMWLDKNPDWDVDVGSSELGKVKGKLLEKVKNRLSEGRCTPTSIQSANAATPPATLAAAAACLDPWSSLLSQGVNLNDPFQMSMLFPLATSNPALLGLPGMPFGLQGLQLPTMPTVSSSSATTTTTQLSGSKGSKESGSSKISSKSETSHLKAQQKAAAAAAEQLAAAASMSAFSFGAGQSASSGIFGLNPFLAASSGAGLLPGFGISPNFAAMAQLQALMGLQSLEAMSPPSSQQVSNNKPSNNSAKVKQTSASDATKSSLKLGSVQTFESPSSAASTSAGGRKLNALVNKLASSKSAAEKNDRKSQR